MAHSTSRSGACAPSVDCPYAFFHQGHWWMLYVGFDGVGYHSDYAFSDDLVHWEKHEVNFEWASYYAPKINCTFDWDKKVSRSSGAPACAAINFTSLHARSFNWIATNSFP